jgi:hypothetical protein
VLLIGFASVFPSIDDRDLEAVVSSLSLESSNLLISQDSTIHAASRFSQASISAQAPSNGCSL